MSLAVVILAAGKGSRMRSALPKVLHPLAGRPLLAHVIDAARALEPGRICVVHGHGGEQVRAAFPDEDLTWVEQTEQLGTGHAVARALPLLDEERVLVLYGDVPLVRPETLAEFVARVGDEQLALMTLEMDDPSGYGRIVRDESGRVLRIVEDKDAAPSELAIREINTGILALPRAFLQQVVPQLSRANAQGEYYLTDAIALAKEAGMNVETMQPRHGWEVDGINDRVQLSRLERNWQRHQAETLMRSGVTLMDPGRIDIRGQVECGEDVTLDVNVILEGNVEIGSGAIVGPNTILRNARIGANTRIAAHTVIDTAVVGEDCDVGPFARLRPGTELADTARVGNFVETKNARIGRGSKLNHLTYAGDTRIGKEVNVGAGTITCNYDGANKSVTELGDGAFIGSNTSLVAPVHIGRGATVGAGSVITRDVAEGELAVARGRQRNVPGWKRPVEKD